MIQLSHITSFDAAYSIVKSKYIHGSPDDRSRLEALPHFYLDGENRTYNSEHNDSQIELIFGSNLNEIKLDHKKLLTSDSTENYVNKIISIYYQGIGIAYWQSVIRPETKNPLFMVGYNVTNGDPPAKLIKCIKKAIDKKFYIQVCWCI